MSTKGNASRGLTEQCQVRGGQEWGLRRRNVGPGGEQVRKGEGLVVKASSIRQGGRAVKSEEFTSDGDGVRTS